MRGRKPELQTDQAAVITIPNPPAWLSKEAKAEWRRIMPLLIERRILTEADMGSVENYCLAIGQIRAAERTIRQEGMTVQGASGLRAHPALKIQSQALTHSRQLAAELGLTPVSRSRPAIREDNEDQSSSDLGL
jgi:P27 family predicted phage terminase small subunit